MKSLSKLILFSILFCSSLYYSSIELNASQVQITFHEDIDMGSSFTWKLKILDYQVPDIWSPGDPLFEEDDKITLKLKEDPSEYPELIGYYLYAFEVDILFDLFRNNEKMTKEEFSWLSAIFGSTPFPFLPIIYENSTEQYNFIDEYYSNLKDLEGIETGSIVDGPFSYNYTTQIEARKNHSFIGISEKITENSSLNTSLFYYFLHWNRFTKIRVNTDTGLVDTIEFIVERFDYEYDYDEELERTNEAYIHYLLQLIEYNKSVVAISIVTSIIVVLVLIVVIRIKRRSKKI